MSGPIGQVDLPSRVSVSQSLALIVDNDCEKQRALKEADRAEFVASIVGSKDIRKELPEPWHLPPSSPDD